MSDPPIRATGRVTTGSSGSRAARKSAARGKGVVYAVLLLSLVGSGGFLWLHPLHAPSGAASGSAEVTLPLETFVVNLEGAGQRAYLRVGITLGLSRPLPHNRKEEAPIALVRDAILSVLASAQPEQLLTSDGKQRLKADLLKALQERAPDLGVENIYFTEFLVQM